MTNYFDLIPPFWQKHLSEETKKPYWPKLTQFLAEEAKKGEQIFPKTENIFLALDFCPLEQIKVVLLGQDPYHRENQAMGLSFGVQESVLPPPSLKNIAKELKSDTGEVLTDFSLRNWARQGVLLLNTTLTVRESLAASHSKSGWRHFTDAIIQTVSLKQKNVVFLLWGRHAQSKSPLIDAKKHKVLQSSHPSPFSAHRGFFGARPFSRTNDFLAKMGQTSIIWGEKSSKS